MVDEAVVAPKVKKPRVLGLILVLLIRSVLAYAAYTTIQEINQAPELYEVWVLPLHYLLLAMGIVFFVGAILIAIYKRLGLVMAAGTTIPYSVVQQIILFTAGGGINLLELLELALSVYVLYYTLKYLRNEPEKSFFT